MNTTTDAAVSVPATPSDALFPMLEFPRAEYQRRLEIVQRGMAKQGLDALLATDEHNIRYLTGYFTEWWANADRRRICWVPAKGEPILVVAGDTVQAAQECSWCEVRDAGGPSHDITHFGGSPLISFQQDLIKAIVETGRELGLHAGSKIGLPMGAWQPFQVSIQVLHGVEEGLGIKRWSDAASLLWEAWAVKSEPEIKYMREAVHVLDRAFPALFKDLKAGMTEVEVAARMRAHILFQGASHYGYVVANLDTLWPKGGRTAPYGQRELRPGAFAYVDGDGGVHGYHSDHNRCFVLGKPTEKQRDAYRVVAKAHYAGIAAMRPGVTTGEIARVMVGVMEEAGHRKNTLGRLGHGMGLMGHPPFIHVDDTTVLREGMTLCCEPNAFVDGVGQIICEDTVVIREHGAEHLSEAPTPTELISV